RLALVAHDNVGLDAAAVGDDAGEGGRIVRGDEVEAAVDVIEEPLRRDDAVLHDLVQAGAELAARQRREHVGIAHDERGRVEGADEVLAGRQVYPDLTADRTVDLGQQRRRDLHQADAAQPRGGREARRVAHDTAAEGNDGSGTVEAAV